MLIESINNDERITERCSTQDCGGQVVFRIEAEGIGAYYCSGCAAKVEQMLPINTQHKEP